MPMFNSSTHPKFKLMAFLYLPPAGAPHHAHTGSLEFLDRQKNNEHLNINPIIREPY